MVRSWRRGSTGDFPSGLTVGLVSGAKFRDQCRVAFDIAFDVFKINKLAADPELGRSIQRISISFENEDGEHFISLQLFVEAPFPYTRLVHLDPNRRV